MIVILTIALLLSMPLPHAVLKNTSHLAEQLQQICLQSIPAKTEQHNSLASLVCGEKISDAELKQNLQKTSLIHIFIVSGSHLLLLDELLSILKIPVYLRFLFLGCYSLGVGWQAPAVRALIGLVVKELFKRKRLFFSADQVVLSTGFITLMLFPAWWLSSSLVMSWCAALALCLPHILRIKNPWVQSATSQFAIFFFMSAPLWGIGNLHPLSMLYNLFLAPVVSYLLLPLSFLAVFFSPFLFVFEKVMTLFEGALSVLSEPIEPTKTTSLTISLLWIWVFSWHILFHFLRLHLWQGKDST